MGRKISRTYPSLASSAASVAAGELWPRAARCPPAALRLAGTYGTALNFLRKR